MKKIFKYNSILILTAILLLNSCTTDSNKKLIIGSWEASLPEFQNETAFPNNSADKIVLTFSKDMTLKNEILHNKIVSSTHTGTYDFEDHQKDLVVYREGNKERKNVAGIIKLDKTTLILVDKSGSGDTLHLMRKQ